MQQAIVAPCKSYQMESGKVSKHKKLKVIKPPKKEGNEGDNTPTKQDPLITFLRQVSKGAEFRRANKLHPAGYELLIYVYYQYVLNNGGVTCWHIARQFSDLPDVSKELGNVYQKMIHLESKGFVEKLGRSGHGRAWLFVPTMKAICALGYICL
jgi:hypothetical protein